MNLPADEREAYVALNMMEGVGPVTVRALVSELGSAREIFSAAENALYAAPEAGKAVVERILAQRGKVDAAAEQERAAGLGVRVVSRADAEYPELLAQIHDPPLALYVKGGLQSGDRRAISVVGTRRATLYGRETAGRLAFRLACAGVAVVSGLARGIDTAAHRGALRGKGRTIAVIGGGIDRIYPAENKALAEEIAGAGAVVSEFPLGREPDRTTFPMRNRIISGLSLGVVVVEAGAASGALITANQALEQGRSVFAVPGRVDSPASRGTHQLIKDGAALVEDIDDILKEFEYLFPPQSRQAAACAGGAPMPATEEELAIVRVLEEYDETDVDTLGRATGMSPAKLNATLVGMELKRLARMLPGGRVRLGRTIS